jgi:hypothetical protein
MNQDKINALLAERAGYVMRKLPARVAAVDAELTALGYRTSAAPKVETAAVEADTERAAAKPRTKRTAD